MSCSPFALVVAERRSGNAPRTAARVAMSREVSEFDLPGSGKLAFSDARPIFRAPLVLVGDGD